jgi:hypothetical protein
MEEHSVDDWTYQAKLGTKKALDSIPSHNIKSKPVTIDANALLETIYLRLVAKQHEKLSDTAIHKLVKWHKEQEDRLGKK